VTKPPLTPAAVIGGRRLGTLLAVALLGHLLLVSLQVNTAGGVTVFNALVFGTVGEVQRAAGGLAGGLGGAWGRYVALWGVHDENVALRAQVGALEVQLQQQRALALKGERLEALLGVQPRVPQRTVAAQVVAGDATAWFRTVTIDRGAREGIGPDMAVLSPRGVVGRVIGRPAPSAHAARVQLLVDRNAAAAALIERSRTGGVVVGDDGGMLRMDFVSTLADVQVGDRVVTSGLDGIYPPGFVIGDVTTVERAGGLYQTVKVRPAVDFSVIEEVLVVVDPVGVPEGPPAQPGAAPTGPPAPPAAEPVPSLPAPSEPAPGPRGATPPNGPAEPGGTD
jgi:rod shape-determining protein MreC